MAAPKNKLKQALENGQVQTGVWLASGSPTIAEVAGMAGFDWCLIDGEHGPNDIPLIAEQARALAGLPTSTMVRIPTGDDRLIKQVLDLGIQNVLVPMVDTADDADRLARAMRYPPFGHRGMGASQTRATNYGQDTEYAHTANDEVFLMVQAETATAMANIPEIASVKGVDSIFIGPADLSADMGYVGQLGHPEVQKTIKKGIEDIVAAGLPAGILALKDDEQARYIEWGATFVGTAGDISTLAPSLRAMAARY